MRFRKIKNIILPQKTLKKLDISQKDEPIKKIL